MAKVKQGFLGNASGKLGNVVFSKWRDKHTARQYQPDVHDAKTPAQIKQRNRMYALLQYLKPLNKNFIKFFNSHIAKGSTPWAVAIKNNMQGITPDGCFLPDKISFGAPKYPAPNLIEVTYNPFIDLASVKYSHRASPVIRSPFPYIGTSVLAKYDSLSDIHEFDTRHLLCFLPEGSFFCSFYDSSHEHVFENSWGHGWLWLMYYDTYDIESHYDPNNGLTEPVNFKPVSMIEEFNTKVQVNPVPVDSISWEYRRKDDKTILLLNLDYKKTGIKNPKDYTINAWVLALNEVKTSHSGPIKWNLENKSIEFDLNETVAKGTFVVLYSVYKKTGEQVACFNRFYIDKNSEGKEFPYFWQLFTCWYAHPVSFVLRGNQCGFCGDTAELFSDFIQLWEQGIISDDSSEEPVTEHSLRLGDDPNGKVDVTGFIRTEGETFIFDSKAKASLVPQAKDGFVFSEWVGVDASEVVKVKVGQYELAMSKERSLSPVFKLLV